MITETRESIHYEGVPLYARVSWSAIFIGAIVGVGLGFLLDLFAIAIGLTAFNSSSTGANAIAIGGFLGMLIGFIAAMVTAGYTAGYLGRFCCPKRNLGILYGFATWTLALVLSAGIAGVLADYVASSSKVTINSTMMQADTTDTASSTPTNDNSDNVVTAKVKGKEGDSNNTMAQVSMPAHTFILSAFLIFLLFFVSAIACCLGACWGMGCKRED